MTRQKTNHATKDSRYSNKHLSALYKQAPPATSPEALDQRILKLAEQEVQKRKPRSWSSHWLAMTSAACAITLTLLVVIRTPESDLPLPSATTPVISPMSLPEESEMMMDTAETGAQIQAQKPQTFMRRATPQMDAEYPALNKEALGKQTPEKKQHSLESAFQAPSPTQAESSAISSGSGATEEMEDEIKLTPEEWLRQIEGMLHDNQIERARESLQTFRQAYPDYPVEYLVEQLAPVKD